ncbi:MAG: hypothetical protein K8H99_09985, partial [Nitrospirae bacterium]|nr:hypothetical protein [Fimbriimonadaceae bacterium]
MNRATNNLAQLTSDAVYPARDEASKTFRPGWMTPAFTGILLLFGLAGVGQTVFEWLWFGGVTYDGRFSRDPNHIWSSLAGFTVPVLGGLCGSLYSVNKRIVVGHKSIRHFDWLGRVRFEATPRDNVAFVRDLNERNLPSYVLVSERQRLFFGTEFARLPELVHAISEMCLRPQPEDAEPRHRIRPREPVVFRYRFSGRLHCTLGALWMLLLIPMLVMLFLQGGSGLAFFLALIAFAAAHAGFHTLSGWTKATRSRV